jgi:DNA-binding transcriptional MerR regulator
VSVKTLRYWEQLGVLQAPQRMDSGYRDYSAGEVDQVRFILSAQSVGLSLKVIGGIIRLRSEGVTPCHHVEDLLKRRLDEIDLRMNDLQRARREVAELLERAQSLDPQECDESSVCHLIATPEVSNAQVAILTEEPASR